MRVRLNRAAREPSPPWGSNVRVCCWRKEPRVLVSVILILTDGRAEFYEAVDAGQVRRLLESAKERKDASLVEVWRNGERVGVTEVGV